MTSLFAPKLPPVQAPPPTPQVDQSVIDRQAQDLARRRKGAAANVLAGDAGAPAGGSVAVKTLLGS